MILNIMSFKRLLAYLNSSHPILEPDRLYDRFLCRRTIPKQIRNFKYQSPNTLVQFGTPHSGVIVRYHKIISPFSKLDNMVFCKFNLDLSILPGLKSFILSFRHRYIVYSGFKPTAKPSKNLAEDYA